MRNYRNINKNYDCTADVALHIADVSVLLNWIIFRLKQRIEDHDRSKLQPPEKEIFDVWTPKLREYEFGSDEYKSALKEMGIGLEHHYAVNRHHPEHFPNGINGMSLIDVIEMVCDWVAASKAKGNKVNLQYLAKRFSISDQLLDIIENTVQELE